MESRNYRCQIIAILAVAVVTILFALPCDCPAQTIINPDVAAPTSTGDLEYSVVTNVDEIIIDASDRGWWNDNGYHTASNKNTFTGFIPSRDLRSFFVFDLSSVSETHFLDAKLRLEIESYYGSEPFEPLTVSDVTTPIAILTASGGGNVAVYDDLGSGNSYADFTVIPSDVGSVLEITLNSHAINDIIAATGGFFAVGLKVNNIGSSQEGVRFSSGSETRVHQLVLTPGIADTLSIEPAAGLVSSGNVGGPFTPACVTYTLTNNSPNSLDWTAAGTQSWLSVAPQSGTLAGGASTIVDVCIDANATFLPIGDYTDTVTFSNLTSGIDQMRNVELNVISPQFKLTASDGASDDFFGFSVSIDGGYAIVGAHQDDDKGSSSGSAYIFKSDGSGWPQQVKLTAPDGLASDCFGVSVSIDGDYAIAGAHGDDDKGTNSGSAYIFKRDGTSWLLQAKLTAADGASGDYFGRSVFINGDYAIVGAYADDDKGSSSGSAYVFKRDGTNWSQQAKLTASDGASSDYFGYSVSIDGDYAVVGAYADDDKGSSSGSAYIFKRDGTNWPQQAKLAALDGSSGDWFGFSASINGDYVIVGAYKDDDKGSDSGSAYIFKRDGTNWSQQAKLTASDGSSTDYFGASVSIDGDYAIVGAYADDDKGSSSGSAYIFKRDGTNWPQQDKLAAPDGSSGDWFGFSASINGGCVIVGAYKDDDKGSDSGSAYVFGSSDPLIISAVIPPEDFNSVGFEGGPFDPNIKEYCLTNNGIDPLDWAVTAPSWLTVDPNTGTLAATADTTVAVYINAEADALEPNSYSGDLLFRNLTTGYGRIRSAMLRVNRVPGEILVTDSIGDPCDCNLPFGDVILGLSRTEHVTIANTDPDYYLIIDLSPPVPPFPGFSDEFPDTVLDPEKWTSVISVPTIDGVGIGEPSAPYSLRLNGHPGGGDAVESRTIDLSGLSGLQLNYWYERTGGGEHSDPGEDLIVEYWNGSTWTELERQLGGGSDMSSFLESVIELPPEALCAEFRLRFRSIGTPSSSSVYDDWFVDNIALTLTDAASVGPGFRLENAPNLPARIEPSSSITFDVVFEPLAYQNYNDILVIYSDDSDEDEIPLRLTGRGIPDYLEIVPDANLEFSGHPGGPFMPTYGYYQLTNIGPVVLQWAAEPNMPCLDITPNGGTLSPGQSITIAIAPNANADLLPQGYYSVAVKFTDITTTLEQIRHVILNVYTEPKAWATPYSFNITVMQGDIMTSALTIGNTGGSNLDFTLSCQQTDYTPAAQQAPESTTEDQNDVLVAAQYDYTVLTGEPFAPERLLVRFEQDPNTAEPNIVNKNILLSNAGGGEVIREYDIVPGLSLVKLPPGTSVEDALVAYNNTPGIIYAQPDYEVYALTPVQKIPNDTRFNDLWGMHNIGQSGGTTDADIDAPEAWNINTGSDQIVVAVIDTGIDYTHPDLAVNMWINQPEKDGAPGIDDDGNGYVDDIYGYDFCNKDGDPWDDRYHGTHCAGTIGASGNNSEGVAGVCWNVKIMAVKFLSSGGSGWTSDAIDSVNYSVLMGANLSSNSWGGGSYSQGLKDAIDAAGAAGMLFVASAGNDNDNTDVYPHYPSSYDCNSLISVMSTDRYDNKSSFSNYGFVSVDLGAPGSSILSCEPGNQYQYLSGTSMATPHVAGACALIWSLCPSLPQMEVKDILMQTVDPIPSLTGRCVSEGRLNVYNAIIEAQTACTTAATAWLELVPDTGIVSADGTVEVEAVFNAERPPGTYQGRITLATNDPYEPEIIIPVTMVVEGVDNFIEWFDPVAPVDPNDPNCNDIAGRTLTFRPDSSASYYRLCVSEAVGFPIDPNGGTMVSLGDDDYAEVYLGDSRISYYGTEYDTFYIGSNGYVTFESGDIHHFETFENHFNLPRISALFDDLDPSAGGTVSWKQLDDRVVVTFENVPEYGLCNSNSFQIEIRYDGKIRTTLTDIAAYDGIVGLSRGSTVPFYFVESNLSEYGVCDFSADFSSDLDIDLADFAILADLWYLQYENGGLRTVRDEFSTVSYSGNDGTFNFAGDWQESGESDGPSSGVIQVIDKQAVNSLCIGDKKKMVHPVINLTRHADLAAATSATLTYDYEVENIDNIGTVSVQVSGNGGANWDTLAVYDYNDVAGSESFDITPYISSDTAVRFETGSQIEMYLYIDNVQIEYHIEPWFYNCDMNKDFSIDSFDLSIFVGYWLQ